MARGTSPEPPLATPPVRYRPAETPQGPPPRRSLLGRIDAALARGVARLAARSYLRKPDVEELLAAKIRGLGAVAKMTGNELAYRLGLERSFRLTSVNIEITNACNLACTMCPVNTTMKRAKRMMPFATFRRILDDNPGLEFLLPFQWGEPLLHKDFYRMVAYARSKGIPAMVTTNGTFLETDEQAERLARAGLDRVTFSSDGVGDTHTEIRGYEWERLRENVLRFRRARDRTGSPTRIDVSMVVMDPTRSAIDETFAAWEGIADRVQAIPLLVAGRRDRSCRELWRGSLVVLADGSVTVCCVDSEGELLLGNVHEDRLRDLWNGARMRELRRAHREKRFPGICAGCDEYEHERVSKRFQ